MTIVATIEPRANECHTTKRKMIPSLPTCVVAAVAIRDGLYQSSHRVLYIPGIIS